MLSTLSHQCHHLQRSSRPLYFPFHLPLLFLVILFSFLFCCCCAQDSFTNSTCRTVPIGGNKVPVCLTYTVNGCQTAVLDGSLTVNSQQYWSGELAPGKQFNEDFQPYPLIACTITIGVQNSPYVVTPTYAQFAVKASLSCVGKTILDIPAEVTTIGEDCYSYNDCYSCLFSGRCGWCEGEAGGAAIPNHCFAENKAESQPYCGTCGQWIYNDRSKCAVPTTTSYPISSTGTVDPSSDINVDTPSSNMSTGGAIALTFVIIGVVGALAVGIYWFWWKKRKNGGRKLVKTTEEYEEETGGAVEMRDGDDEKLNRQKAASDFVSGPLAAKLTENRAPDDL